MFRTLRVLLVFVAALGVFAERAAAQIPSADGKFYACVRIDRDREEGRLTRLVAASEACRRNETRVSWNAAGPQGQPGINGTPGINGIDGTNGTNGIDGINGIDGTNGTRADAPCFDNTNRYVDCGNGTVTDTVTGLIWLRVWDCLGSADWAAANGAAAVLANGQCGLTDGSSAGDWRLPTKDEWSATIARAVGLNCTAGRLPTLTNDAGTACQSAGPSSFGAGVAGGTQAHWSSTTNETLPVRAWFVSLGNGDVSHTNKDVTVRVWPVRSGRPN